MKYLIAILAVLVLTGCGTDGEGGLGGEDFHDKKVRLDDGRVITCVVFHAINEGGISCDWANPELDD